LPREEWQVPEGKLALRLEESASSLEKALGCELAYVLGYSARLKGEDRETLKYEDRTRGLIAHAVIAEVFEPGTPLAPTQARTKAQSVFDKVIRDLAPTLSKESNANERSDLKSRILLAVETYASFLGANGITIAGTEVEVERSDRTLEGVHLTGVIDHVLKDRSGRNLIVDHKWGSSKYKREALETGGSLQLALYSLLISAGTEPVLAYHMIRDRNVMTLNLDYTGGKRIEGPEGREVVKRAAAGIKEAKALLSKGVLRARGLGEDEGRDFEAPCSYCDFDRLCGRYFKEEA
jgi:RecB family exonuclease